MHHGLSLAVAVRRYHLLCSFLFSLCVQVFHSAFNHPRCVFDCFAFALACTYLFSLVLACNIRCIMTQSISWRLSLMVRIKTVHAGSLIAASCQFGCVAGKCTNISTDPAAQLFKVSAPLSTTSNLGRWSLHVGCTRVQPCR